MKAVAWTDYGAPEDALKIIEAEKPIPGKDEVLIQVFASTVTAGDVRLRAFRVPIGFWLPARLAFGLFKPRKSIPGMEFSGVVEAVGNEVASFKIGDKVYGTAGMRLGAHAGYLCLPEKAAFVGMPEDIHPHAAVAAVFGGLAAIHFLKEKAKLGAGQSILIHGASGAVGTASIQLAKVLGAEVTAVCSTGNLDLVKSLGADKTVDYTRESIGSGGETYDVVLDAVGNLPWSLGRKLLKEQGKFIALNGGLRLILASVFNKRIVSGVAAERKDSLAMLGDLLARGALKPVVDRVYPLERTVEAHAYVDTGHKKGNVVIRLD